jgi:hypothetical protein
VMRSATIPNGYDCSPHYGRRGTSACKWGEGQQEWR